MAALPTMSRDYGGHIDSPSTVRMGGRPVGLWWSEQVWGPGNITDRRYLAMCAKCEEVLEAQLRLRDLRTAFADHLHAAHVQGDAGEDPR